MRSAKTGKATVASGSPSNSRRKTKDVLSISARNRLGNSLICDIVIFRETYELFSQALLERKKDGNAFALMKKVNKLQKDIHKKLEKYFNQTFTDNDVECIVHNRDSKHLANVYRSLAEREGLKTLELVAMQRRKP